MLQSWWRCTQQGALGNADLKIPLYPEPERCIVRRLNSAWSGVVWQEILEGFKKRPVDPQNVLVLTISSTQNFFLQGCSVAGDYRAAQVEAAQHIWLSPLLCIEMHLYKPLVLRFLPDAGYKGRAEASWASIWFVPPATSWAITESLEP